MQTDIDDATTKQKAAKAANTKKRNTIKTSRTNAGGIAKQIKAHPAYDEVDGQTLGIIGPEDTTDPTTAKPTLSLLTVTTGQVGIGFVKGIFDGIRIESKRGSETQFTFLATDTEPPYIDTRANLVAGQAESREYRAQYLDGDDPVGVHSDVLVVTVPG